MVSPEYIKDRDLMSDCLAVNTVCFGICVKLPAAVVYPESIRKKSRQDSLDSHNGQNPIVC
jgi:hypothetical protein